MPSRIQDLARETGEPIPRTPVAITRTILDSLALAYRRNVRLAATLAGREVDVVHLVGGGSQNALLCQLTADALGVPVLAGRPRRPPSATGSCRRARSAPTCPTWPRCGR